MEWLETGLLELRNMLIDPSHISQRVHEDDK